MYERIIKRGLVGLSMALYGLLNVTSAATPTNFVIIYTDDLGYGDLGCYGAEGYETPELDHMAEEGMMFTDFSTSSSICTPSRAGLLTGRYAKRWGHNDKVYFPQHTDGMPSSEITIPEILKEADYRTGMVGKWHLGHMPEYLPTAQGFDMYYGIPYSNDMWQTPSIPLAEGVLLREGRTVAEYENAEVRVKDGVPLMSGNEVIEWPVDQAQLTRRYTKKAQEFIEANKDEPFFLYVAHTMPHVPLFVSDAFAGKSERGLFGDVIEEIDWSVGEILKTLKENGLDKNTLVIFTSDNGPWLSRKENAGSSGPLRDGKFTPYEGGSRVPCIAWLPGYVPEGVTCDEQTSTLDILPTIASLVGLEVPHDRFIDGLDIVSVLTGEAEDALEREYYLFRGETIRVGDWKYNKTKTDVELFNLSEDIGEERNLAAQYPEKVSQLAKKLAEVMETF